MRLLGKNRKFSQRQEKFMTMYYFENKSGRKKRLKKAREAYLSAVQSCSFLAPFSAPGWFPGWFPICFHGGNQENQVGNFLQTGASCVPSRVPTRPNFDRVFGA
jgi:hypothetical protein